MVRKLFKNSVSQVHVHVHVSGKRTEQGMWLVYMHVHVHVALGKIMPLGAAVPVLFNCIPIISASANRLITRPTTKSATILYLHVHDNSTRKAKQ